MNGAYLAVAGRIRQELQELAQVVERATNIWRQAAKTPEDHHIDATALNLHGFYAGMERMFEVIADRVDRAKPAGPNWHQELLLQMAAEIPNVRPAAISSELRDKLDRYRGFRHVVRNVYTYNLDPEQVDVLVRQLRLTMEQASRELSAFADLLEQLGME